MAGKLQFGVYELDRDAMELRKHGVPIRLQEQPLRVLATLVERPGEIVTREELQQQIWGKDTFVDFEQSLNKAVNRLREALNDEAGQLRYVETVPRRGYRFIAPVHEVVSGQRSRLWKMVVPAAVLLGAALVAGVLYHRSHRAKPLTDKDTIVLADFANCTGDVVFDNTLKQALSLALNQSPFLNVLSDNRVATTLQLMTRPANTALTPEVALELCLRAGSKAYIAGSIAILGSEYVLGWKAVNCQNGDLLAQQQVTAAAKEKVLDALGEASFRLRAQLGESKATMVPEFNVPLVEATSSSLEALKAYSLGIKYGCANDIAALPYFQRAVQLDPNFVMAYLSVGNCYEVLGELRRASKYYAKAFELREHASERESFRSPPTTICM